MFVDAIHVENIQHREVRGETKEVVEEFETRTLPG